jgi:hypothetical protein
MLAYQISAKFVGYCELSTDHIDSVELTAFGLCACGEPPCRLFDITQATRGVDTAKE